MGNDRTYNTIKSENLRELLLRVCDGFADLAPLLFYLKDMRRADEACKWLIKSGLTGRNLYILWVHEYGKSALMVMARINQGLEHEDKMRPIRLGRDIL